MPASKFASLLSFLLVFTSSILSAQEAQPTQSKQTSPPNVVFILADDLGYRELGCYGQTKIKTPHLDQLATEGMRFTRHYAGAPVCAPSRCVLLTGQHMAHASIRANRPAADPKVVPFPGQFPLPDEDLTIAEVFQQAGYVTGAFGKWGLGPVDSSGAPHKQGFDYFFGYNCQRNAHSFYPPHLYRNQEKIVFNEDPIPGHITQEQGAVNNADYRGKNYAPEAILEEALAFIDRNHEAPFFLYLPFVEPHVAIHPSADSIAQYPAAWDEGREPYRGTNKYVPSATPRAAYAAMISDLDSYVGAVREKLQALGLTENTLIIFTSDNGTTHPAVPHLGEAQFHIGGVDARFFNSIGELNGWKGSVDEGGLRVPAIAYWPGKTPANSVSGFPSYAADWFATLCGAISQETPANIDGLDLTPILDGSQKSLERSKPMIWEFHGYGGQIAIIDGDWKAVRKNVFRPAHPSPWELYLLDRDPGESRDLAASVPYAEKLQEMVKFYENERTQNPTFLLPRYDDELIRIRDEQEAKQKAKQKAN